MNRAFVNQLKNVFNLKISPPYFGHNSYNKLHSLHTEPVLQDTHGRNHTYLRISLTERCNLRCSYCMPEEGVPLKPNTEILQKDEIVKLVKFFVRNGVNKVRFTGGEPLVRKDCLDIIKEISQLDGLKKIGLTTNGQYFERA